MPAICTSTLALAQWQEQHTSVTHVYHPGLASHPQHELAGRPQDDYGGIVSFELMGGKQDAWKLIDATRVFSITANLGDTKSTVTHPATTTHGRLTPEQRDAAGISDSLIRLAVGLESVADLQADLERGFSKLRS